MVKSSGFEFDLEGPLDLYGCGHCGSQDIEAYGAGDVFCRKCREITTAESWQEWCNDQDIDITLGPFLEAMKRVNDFHRRPFDPATARSRYLGESKAHMREALLAEDRELREFYWYLTVRNSDLPRFR
jgi:hypothetical protein